MIALADEAATLAAGRRLAAALPPPGEITGPGLHLHLEGPLGAGKTTLVRGLLRGAGFSGAVRSPTYTLVEPYHLDGLELYHFDLYRLADPEELELLGAREYFRAGAVCCVEWPERGRGWLPPPSLVLRLAHAGDARTLAPEARDEVGAALAEALRATAVS